ncbi:MAG: potassium transporter KefB [Bacteroidetes bacterium]|jgi:hypothetical protein|nr:potassium transporter KefB [Bacteroidota bacterium]MDF2453358.1 potassium transporter KefB [Bacteroidota bacterium]
MTQENNLKKQPDQKAAIVKPMLIGAAIGLIFISFFVFGVDQPNPDWPKFWMVRPLVVVPVAGAIGGLFYSFMDYQCSRGFNRTVAVLLSLIVFVIGLWMGTVLGLVGTMWH